MYYHLVKDFPGQIARIVDAGCFGGASTVAFSRGLKESDRPLHPNMIVSYDLFETDRYSSEIFAQFGMDAPLGSSFLPHFLRTIDDHLDIVSVVKGSILDFNWHGGSIDILFLDVLKSQELNDHCVRNFFPHLIAGKSLVLQQDYIHDPLPWIPMTMALMADHFETLGFCRNTLAFRCVRPVTPQDAERCISRLKALSLAEKEKLFEKILADLPDGAPHVQLNLSRIWMMLYHGDLARTRKEIEAFPITEDWHALKASILKARLGLLESEATAQRA